jgi:hypothetical protein
MAQTLEDIRKAAKAGNLKAAPAPIGAGSTTSQVPVSTVTDTQLKSLYDQFQVLNPGPNSHIAALRAVYSAGTRGARN